jgi:hypothetical protein
METHLIRHSFSASAPSRPLIAKIACCNAQKLEHALAGAAILVCLPGIHCGTLRPASGLAVFLRPRFELERSLSAPVPAEAPHANEAPFFMPVCGRPANGNRAYGRKMATWENAGREREAHPFRTRLPGGIRNHADRRRRPSIAKVRPSNRGGRRSTRTRLPSRQSVASD